MSFDIVLFGCFFVALSISGAVFILAEHDRDSSVCVFYPFGNVRLAAFLLLASLCSFLKDETTDRVFLDANIKNI
jgi:hypothetical protein